MSWTKERTELLRKLWTDGRSASQVAAELGGGLTRNAVIGKIHRLGIQDRRSEKTSRTQRFAEIQHKEVATLAKKAKIVAVAIPPAPPPVMQRAHEIEPTPPPDGRGVTLMDLRFTSCRFPLGDPREQGFRFCGAPRESLSENRQYCTHHNGVAYETRKERTERNKAADEARRLAALNNGAHAFRAGPGHTKAVAK
jgi:GcrA cell cycle regulator